MHNLCPSGAKKPCPKVVFFVVFFFFFFFVGEEREPAFLEGIPGAGI